VILCSVSTRRVRCIFPRNIQPMSTELERDEQNVTPISWRALVWAFSLLSSAIIQLRAADVCERRRRRRRAAACLGSTAARPVDPGWTLADANVDTDAETDVSVVDCAGASGEGRCRRERPPRRRVRKSRSARAAVHVRGPPTTTLLRFPRLSWRVRSRRWVAAGSILVGRRLVPAAAAAAAAL
jgi:hypothetical protein